MCSQARYISCSAISCRPLFLFKAAALKLEGKNQTRGDFHSLSIFLFVFNYSDQRLDIEIHYDFRAARPEQLPNATLHKFFFLSFLLPFYIVGCFICLDWCALFQRPKTINCEILTVSLERERERESPSVWISHIMTGMFIFLQKENLERLASYVVIHSSVERKFVYFAWWICLSSLFFFFW